MAASSRQDKTGSRPTEWQQVAGGQESDRQADIQTGSRRQAVRQVGISITVHRLES